MGQGLAPVTTPLPTALPTALPTRPTKRPGGGPGTPSDRFSLATELQKIGRMGTMIRLADLVVRLALTAAITGLMLVPSGVCLCGHVEEDRSDAHPVGAPEVPRRDRPGPAAHYAGDAAPGAILAAANDDCPAGPPREVARVSHGPPRSQPLYLTLQTLLI